MTVRKVRMAVMMWTSSIGRTLRKVFVLGLRVWSVGERYYLCISMMVYLVKVSFIPNVLSLLSSYPEPTGDCCDNCLHRLGISHDLIQLPLANEVKDEPIDGDASVIGAGTSKKRSATGIVKVEELETCITGVFNLSSLSFPYWESCRAKTAS
jgi:hypothetical protein